MTSGSVERIRLETADGTQAEVVPALGGIVSSLQFATKPGLREVLFQHDHFWDAGNPATRGGIPMLFPACGRVRLDGASRYRVQECTYALPIHGFAMRRPWTVDGVTGDSVDLSFRTDADTRATFPFEFSLRMRCRVQPGVLEVGVEIQHEGDVAMPFSAGWHPYFLTPDAPVKDAMQIDLPATASGRYDESFTQIPGWDAPLGFPLRPDHPRFRDTLHRAGPGPARVLWPDGYLVELEATAGDGPMPYWQLHTEPDRPYVCVEPWSSPPNALNSGQDLQWLKPGGAWAMSLSIRCGSNR